MGNVIKYKEAPVSLRSRMDTIVVTPQIISSWSSPGFQRPLKINDKVRSIAEQIKADGVIPGVITLGQISHGGPTYIIDGQHRLAAASISEVKECYADVRICKFDSMAEMGAAFVELNSQIVRFAADDILRGLEGSLTVLKVIREGCPFVGYSNIRRQENSPTLLGMATALRCWSASQGENIGGSSKAAVAIAHDMSVEQAQRLVVFLNVVRSAWGSDMANSRLWGACNLTMMMWMWRVLVLEKDRIGKKAVVLTNDQFRKCAMSVSADASYVDWLLGRNAGERDRSPCYMRLKAIFVARLMAENPKAPKPKLPQPAWAS